MFWNSWGNGYCDIDIYVKDIIGDIPTAALEEELNRRKELQVSNIKEAEREESRRDNYIEYSVDLDSNDLMRQDECSLSNFCITDVVDFLEGLGYNVSMDEIGAGSFIAQLNELPRWKYKDILCDMFGLAHFASNEDIITALKERLNNGK